MSNAIRRVCVVVPAHNEARRIDRCLIALKEAARRVTVPVDTVVVCDACQDGTARRCTAEGIPVLGIHARCVGIARHVGIAKLLRDVDYPRNVWLANTDADSIVPPTWLRDQIAIADLGVDAVAGTVSLTAHYQSELLRAFDLQYRRRVATNHSHPHVHGANLGVRASAYLDVGGFAPQPNHEDVRLVQALERGGYPIAHPDWLVVATSSRLIGRCEQGFAAYLSRLHHREPSPHFLDTGLTAFPGRSCESPQSGRRRLARSASAFRDTGESLP